ncbi:hypothetical protein HWV62_27462 [Athelia sp. TMB]|nr:hypothetical protein HWV62_27462 [Athelia sp. TMB]
METFFNTTVTQNTIYEPILDHVPPCTIYSFGRVSKSARTCIENYHLVTFNINRHLATFLPDPIAFRSMQARTGAVISGSNVVQLLDRTYYNEADLDIYVNPGHGYEVGEHMIREQGFRLIDKHAEQPTKLDLEASIEHLTLMAMGAANEAVNTLYRQGSIHIVCFMEHITDRGQVREAQLIMTADTCVMNIITFDKAVALYPLATFEMRTNHRMVLHGALASTIASADQAIVKYTARDFVLQREHAANECRVLFAHGCDRKVGDRWCWTIKFNMQGVARRKPLEKERWSFKLYGECQQVAPTDSEDPVMENKWRMLGNWTCLSVKYCVLRFPIFRYAYTVADVMEALCARKFSDDISVVRRRGSGKERKWFDDNIQAILEGGIDVLVGDEIIGDRDFAIEDDLSDLGATEQWPGHAFPLKITDNIDGDLLMSMAARYCEVFEMEEMEGKNWRKDRDDMKK